MIVNCEQCQARYLVASLLLGSSGRKVRCGVCHHTWFQTPGDEKYDQPHSFQEHLTHEILEPIPEGVRPIPEGSTIPVLSRSKFKFNWKETLHQEPIGGGLLAVVVFFLAFGGLVLLHVPLIKAWPPSALLFHSIGLEIPQPGEGLIFDHVTAKAKTDKDGTYGLTLTGNIINLKKSFTEVPTLWATLRKSATAPGARFRVPIDKKALDPEGTIPFAVTYSKLPDDMTEVMISFAAK